jgi:hypothetical protein
VKFVNADMGIICHVRSIAPLNEPSVEWHVKAAVN